MNKKRRISGAPIVMRKRGEITDSIVLQEIMKKPGSTISELASKLGWTNGKVDGSVNRLVAKGKVLVKHCLKRGTLLKKVYPADHVAKSHDIIEIPKEMINYEEWKDNATVYAISRSTIGISPTEIEEWSNKSFFREKICIEKDGLNVIIKLPETFSRFYQLENSDISLSSIGNLVLVTVESFLPVELPPEYPEESRYAITRYKIIIESEKIEGVSSHHRLLLVDLKKGEAKGIRISEFSQIEAPRKSEEKILLTADSFEPIARLIKVPIEA